MTQTLTPYLTVPDAAAAIAWYRDVFAAEEIERWTGPDGRVGHAELRFGTSRVFLADESPEVGAISALSAGGNPTALVITVADADAAIAAAVARQGVLDRPIVDSEHGMRSGWITDPFGYRWNIGHRITSPAPVEVADRVRGQYDVSTGGSH